MEMNLGKRLKQLFSSSKISEDFFEDLEDAMVESDIGARLTMNIVTELKQRLKLASKPSNLDIKRTLKEILSENILVDHLEPQQDKLNIYLVLGVNGVGKTTSIAKLGKYWFDRGLNPLFAACDTFRAAAIDQLLTHASRLDIRAVAQSPGSDPGAVLFDSIDSALSKGNNVILADTAGRMHNKANLVKELQKMDKIISNKVVDLNYKKILVIDTTTGQNGLRQAEIFHDAVGIDGLILTKYDSSSKGGIIISICQNLSIPVSFIGTGEKYTDFSFFEKEVYLDDLIS